MRFVQSALTLWVLAQSTQVWAFPDNVRHGYQNCTTCHVSPNGGGVLTQYGRELSKEVQSMSSLEGEQGFLYGAVTPPSWLSLGGDFRQGYLYRDTEIFRSGRSIFMQADFEAAASWEKWTALATIGMQDPDLSPEKNRVLSRRHWLMHRMSEEWGVRAGKFDHSFGIKTPDHAISIRKGLGWDQGSETHNVELSYLGEKYNFYATLLAGRIDNDALFRDSGLSLSGSWAATDLYKIGASYYYGDNSKRLRHVFGPHAILAFSPHFYLLTQMNLQSTVVSGPRADSSWGFIDYHKLGYELTQGLHLYHSQERTRVDFSRSRSLNDSYGAGVQWFPRPHLELNVSWQLMRISASSDDFTDYAWILFHYYL